MTENEYVVVARHYGLDQPPNFENKYWHLRVSAPAGDERLLEQAKAQLFAAREKRVRPGRDEKILVSWNALAIRAWRARARVRAARMERLGAPRAGVHPHENVARRAPPCHLQGRPRPLERLSGRLRVPARCTARADAKPFPRKTWGSRSARRVLLEQFEDPDAGGFFFTARDHERLIHRPKPGHDNATPSGNAVAAWALGRLAALTGNERHARAAQRTLELFLRADARLPGGIRRHDHCARRAALAAAHADPERTSGRARCLAHRAGA